MNKGRKLFIICVLISMLISSCSFAEGVLDRAHDQDLTVMAAALPTVTPTPFMPVTAEEVQEAEELDTVDVTVESTATPDVPQYVWGSFPGPSDDSSIEIPPPMPEVALSDKAVTFALLGSDQRADGYGYRTDSIIVVSVDPSTDRVVMLSVPRDLYVYIPGWRMERINAADAHGGEETLEQTILYNFGISVDYWARINFGGFIAAIDSLGGIDVEVTGYLYDEYGGTWYEYGPGTYHMNGYQTLGYVRMRKNSSDFDRLRRQQEVIKAVFKKIVSLDGLTRIPDLYEQFNALFQTNIGVADMLPLIPIGTRIASGSVDIQGYTLTPTEVSSWTVPYTGAAVLLPNRDVLIDYIQQIFSE